MAKQTRAEPVAAVAVESESVSPQPSVAAVVARNKQKCFALPRAHCTTTARSRWEQIWQRPGLAVKLESPELVSAQSSLFVAASGSLLSWSAQAGYRNRSVPSTEPGSLRVRALRQRSISSFHLVCLDRPVPFRYS